MRLLVAALCVVAPLPTQAIAQLAAPTPVLGVAPRLSDAELAAIRGKFILPNGAEIAMTVTSDAIVNGQLLLRTVFAVDQAVKVDVFARRSTDSVTTQDWSMTPESATPTGAGVTVMFDRQSGTQVITPNVAVGRSVTVSGNHEDPALPGLVPVAVAAGGPAVRIADGTVSLASVRNGTQVTFAGDQLGIAQLVGQSIATAVLNSGNDRTVDTLTNIDIDLRDVTPFALGSAGMRVDALALDAARGMIR